MLLVRGRQLVALPGGWNRCRNVGDAETPVAGKNRSLSPSFEHSALCHSFALWSPPLGVVLAAIAGLRLMLYANVLPNGLTFVH
jgi:hypothetical protein